MNLVNGQVLDTAACDALLDTLEARLQRTLAGDRLDPAQVVAACTQLLDNLDEQVYLDIMATLGIGTAQGIGYLAQARAMFGADALRARLQRELGEHYPSPTDYTPSGSAHRITEQVLPLGVLLHIAAGNADGLPAFSVLEGLLTGNINILKLPAADGGLSIRLLLELLRYVPQAAEFIYVFDYSSRDIDRMQALIELADGVVVWGGDAAVRTLRSTIPPHIRIIEWGHKLSFSYVTASGITDEGLAGLAEHIITTKQLLCSSCQGIFLDTDCYDDVTHFCRRFLPFLEDAACNEPTDIGILSQSTLQLYADELEAIYTPRDIYRGRGGRCSVTAHCDRALTLSHQFGHPWVRALPRSALLAALRPHKNHLQTAGLLAGEDERQALTDTLLRTGVVRVCAPRDMSKPHPTAAHDGEFPLRRYTKIAAWGHPAPQQALRGTV